MSFKRDETMDLIVFIVLLCSTMYDRTQCVTLTTFSSVYGEISERIHFIHETFPVEPSTRAIIEVDASVPVDYFLTPNFIDVGIYTTQDHINIKRQCTEHWYGQVGNRNLHPRITILHDSRSLTCKVDTRETTHCTGNITVQDFKPRSFSFSFGFPCHHRGSLRGLVYNVSIIGTNETECFDLGLTGDAICPLMEQGVFPNLLGGENKKDISLDAILASQTCYQYSRRFLCYLFIPHCSKTRNIICPPCREVCYRYMNGCRHLNYLLHMYINCDYLPSSNGDIYCIDDTSDCFEPPRLAHGTLFINETRQRKHLAEYSCDDGFSMEGNSTIFCMYNGRWSSKPPTCLPSLTALPTIAPKRESWVLVLTTVFILYILAMVVITIAALYKMKLNAKVKIDQPLLLFKREKVAPHLPRKRKFDAFVLYHFDSDDDFIMNHLLPQLEEAQDFKLHLHSRDFTPGRDIKDNIEEAIDNSNSAIIVISQGFVDSPWCKEEFTHCYIENMNDAAFKLFVIMMQPTDTLVNISKYMNTFLANKTYLQKDDPDLLTKLGTHLEIERKPADEDYKENQNNYDVNTDGEMIKEFKLFWPHEKTLETREIIV